MYSCLVKGLRNGGEAAFSGKARYHRAPLPGAAKRSRSRGTDGVMLMLAAVTRASRHQVFADIDDAIVGLGGWVEGHSLFSNAAATFRLVLPARAFGAFAGRLEAAGARLDKESREAIAAIEPSDRETFATLAVTFIHDEPDLRREVPPLDG